MTYNPSGLSAGHSSIVAENRQDNPTQLNIDPRTGDYLIEDKGRTPEFNTLRLIAIGSLYAVNNCRDRLHQLGYAHPSEWSQPLPMSNTGGILRGLTPTDVMRILTKRISLPKSPK
ncbi:MAG: hypothetical protein ACFB5Z_16365 [Elainellaceae cyanobacterium]